MGFTDLWQLPTKEDNYLILACPLFDTQANHSCSYAELHRFVNM